MILTLLIIAIVLALALWLTVMALWWRAEQGLEAKTVDRRDVIHHWNKAARLARRGWYGSLRYTGQASRWSNKKVTAAFIAVFPKSKAAFVEQDPLIGLQHGPSSYFLANLTRKYKKPTVRKIKKVDLSDEEKSDIVV